MDTKILGCCWIELPAGKWFKRDDSKITSRCQIEADIAWTDFIVHAPEGEWSSVAKFRILSFDIECAGRKGIFPEPNIDRVIQIANVVRLHGSNENFVCVVFTLDTCAPIGHAEVIGVEKVYHVYKIFIVGAEFRDGKQNVECLDAVYSGS